MDCIIELVAHKVMSSKSYCRNLSKLYKYFQAPFQHSTDCLQVGARVGVYDVLDNLGFYNFEETLSDNRMMSVRWRSLVPNIPWQGDFQ